MQVETYQEQEISFNKEELEGHKELCEQLGLIKQVELHREKTVDVYRKMTAEEVFVFLTNFPNQVELKDYQEFIPVRVLQIVAHYREVHPEMKVWLACPEPGRPDPVVYGSQYQLASWNTSATIIARFGSALEDFSVLRKRALEIMQKRLSNLDVFSFQQLSAIQNAIRN
jgi:hypothetical protein